MKKTFTLLFSIISFSVFAQGGEAKFRKIDSLMTYLYQNGKFMGSLTLREKDKVVFSKAYGFADIGSKVKATTQTKYKIGSITKMFTASVVFQLIQEKKLKPDTKLSTFFPKIKNADKITIANMLNHSSGIYNYTNDSTFTPKLTTQQLRRDMLEQLYKYDAVFEPGTKAEYSNSNYLLLGFIIQDITHKSYKDNVTSRIINKVGLKNTKYYGKIDSKKNEAYSYKKEGDTWVKQEEWHETVAGAAGALQSTPEDLTKFITALWAGKIINPESLAHMTTMDFSYGKGVFNFPFGERKFYGHNGGIEAFESVVGYYPKEELAVSLITNGIDCNFNDTMIGILSCYYKLPYRFPTFDAVALDENTLKKFEGDYTNASLPFVINVALVKGQLRVHADEQGTFYITPLSETEFIHEGSGVKMIFDPKGFTLEQNGSATYFNKK
ncbi:serine hydrolase domain-containing protein [Flavobacterium sp. RHBU_3]|uniref:serine hydrolase domain-containing protein n=1 Tax=Flavobacterium sp. RHBU_3 TaxID=3391184 RepID=UPI0039851F95